MTEAAYLTAYAAFTRYPGLPEPVTQAQYQRAVAAADGVVAWAERIIGAAASDQSSG